MHRHDLRLALCGAVTATVTLASSCEAVAQYQETPAMTHDELLNAIASLMADAVRTGVEVERERCAIFRAALEQIAAIKNQEYGPDYAEIEEARMIANQALGRAVTK